MSIRISLVGDTMIGRLFNDLFEEDLKFNIWGNTKTHIKKSDLFLINLETTITDSLDKWPNKAFNYKLSPSFSHILKDGNVKYCNLANNHILDFKKQGLIDTIETLDKLNIKHSGAGLNNKEASEPASFNIRGTKIAIISASDHPKSWSNKKNNYKGREGILIVNYSDYSEILRLVRKVKRNHDILIFSVHWGPNFASSVSPKIRKFAHDLVNNGVDIVHGHSAHHVQEIEIIDFSKLFQGTFSEREQRKSNRPFLGKKVKQKVDRNLQTNNSKSIIIYGNGDFVEDFAINQQFRSDLGFVADIYIKENQINKLKILPTKIRDLQVNFATGKEIDFVLNRTKIKF